MKMNRTLRKMMILFQIFFFGIIINLSAQTLKEIESHVVSLPNGWKLTPVGKLLPLGDLPLNIAISPSKKLAAITNNGESCLLYTSDAADEEDSVDIGGRRI